MPPKEQPSKHSGVIELLTELRRADIVVTPAVEEATGDPVDLLCLPIESGYFRVLAVVPKTDVGMKYIACPATTTTLH